MLNYYIINIQVLYTKDKAYVKKEETGGGISNISHFYLSLLLLFLVFLHWHLRPLVKVPQKKH